MFEPSQPGLDDLVQLRQFRLQVRLSRSSEAIGLTAFSGTDGPNEAALFEPGDRSVERTGPKPCTGECFDIDHHGVTVLFAVGQTCEDEERGV